MTIHLYAEHLVNIRTLSIQASLSTVSDQQTSATLSADGDVLTLSHDGETASIRLPIKAPGGHNDATLTIPAAPSKDLSFRVSLQEKSGTNGLITNASDEDSNVIPWSAVSLTPHTEIACQACNTAFVRRGRIQVWKDLPSENWAEMMDFWHCHRPDVPHDHNHALPQKGYSADSRLALEPGVAMVDPVDFVLATEDCENISVGRYSPSRKTVFPNSFNLHERSGKKEPALPGREVSIKGRIGIQLSNINRAALKSELAFKVGLMDDRCRSQAFHCHVQEFIDLAGYELDT